MGEITKDDLNQTENRILARIEEKFDENEKRQKLIFNQLQTECSHLGETVAEHEDILRGRDRTSGMIKKINYLWVVAGTGATALFWKSWEFLTSK